jgi:hypothetical protein
VAVVDIKAMAAAPGADLDLEHAPVRVGSDMRQRHHQLRCPDEEPADRHDRREHVRCRHPVRAAEAWATANVFEL